MAFDMTHLAKFMATRDAEWSPNDKPQLDLYNQDFLVGYLLHYCRLNFKLNRKGNIPLLQALLEIEPENGEIHYLLARQYELEGNVEEAMVSFERASTLRPDKPTYALAAVRAACWLGERNKALSMVSNVITTYPNMPEAFYERGLIYETDENWEWALKNYEKCTTLNQENPDYFCAEARMNRYLKRYTMARRAVQRALKINPKHHEALEESRHLPVIDQIFDKFRAERAEKVAAASSGGYDY
jgi:tetratricopeptide (TPR) repeat protein